MDLDLLPSVYHDKITSNTVLFGLCYKKDASIDEIFNFQNKSSKYQNALGLTLEFPLYLILENYKNLESIFLYFLKIKSKLEINYKNYKVINDNVIEMKEKDIIPLFDNYFVEIDKTLLFPFTLTEPKFHFNLPKFLEKDNNFWNLDPRTQVITLLNEKITKASIYLCSILVPFMDGLFGSVTQKECYLFKKRHGILWVFCLDNHDLLYDILKTHEIQKIFIHKSIFIEISKELGYSRQKVNYPHWNLYYKEKQEDKFSKLKSQKEFKKTKSPISLGFDEIDEGLELIIPKEINDEIII
jgi:hypothetical protein